MGLAMQLNTMAEPWDPRLSNIAGYPVPQKLVTSIGGLYESTNCVSQKVPIVIVVRF